MFFIFSAQGRGKGSEGPGGRGGRFFMENPRRGGGSPRRVGAGGRGSRRVFEGIFLGGGVLNIFFGAEIPTKNSNT